MYTSTGEPCVGALHLLTAFPRAGAVLGCLVGAYFLILGPNIENKQEYCEARDGYVVDAGDSTTEVLCVIAE